MPATTDDDPETMPDAELLAMPGEAIPLGWLTAFFTRTRKAEFIRQHDAGELALDLSADYGAEPGGEYQISTVPAFTRAAEGQGEKPSDGRKDTENETAETKNTPRPIGQGAPKFQT